MGEEQKKNEYQLRDYQKDAVNRIDEIFNSEEFNRYSAVVLPTGAGKSFIAIEKILSFDNPSYQEKLNNNEKVINDSKMVYIAPTREILSQVKLHIAKHVLSDSEGIKEKSVNDINKMISEAFPNLKFKCYASVKNDDEKIMEDDIIDADFIIVDEVHRLGAQEWEKKFRENISKNKKAKILSITATPDRNDKLGKDMVMGMCDIVYPGKNVHLNQYVAYDLYLEDAIRDGVVVPPLIKSADFTLFKSNQYNEILEKYRSASADSKDKKRYLSALEKMDDIIGLLNEDERIAFYDGEIPAEVVEKRYEEKIGEVIKCKEFNKNGKYIAFIPANRTNGTNENANEKPDSVEYFKKYMDKIRKNFENVKGKNGKPINITFSVVTSNGNVKLNEQGMIDSKGKTINNSEVIKQFEDAPNDSDGIKILLSNNLLNEGIHVDGINGVLMYRKTESPIIYLQEIGRCISSRNPELPISMQNGGLILDFVGNTYTQIINNDENKLSRQYDLAKMKEICQWIKNHDGKMPNVDGAYLKKSNIQEKISTEYEVRLAIALKALKERYYFKKEYENNNSLDDEINEIIKLADENDLWNKEVPDRTKKPLENMILGEKLMELSKGQKDFLKIYDDIVEKTNKISPQARINKLLNILKVIKKHKKEIKFPQEISVEVMYDNKRRMYESGTNTSNKLSEFLKENFTEKECNKINDELVMYTMFNSIDKRERYKKNEDYDIGQEIAYVKGKLWTSEMDYIERDEKYFKKYSLKDLKELGIMDDYNQDTEKLVEISKKFIEKKKQNQKDYIRRFILDSTQDEEKGLLRKGSLMEPIKFGLIEEFECCSLASGERFFKESDNDKFDRDGYNINGYDKEGYNRFGFNQDGVHKTTGREFDERGFYLEPLSNKYINRDTNDEYDLLGYNIYGINNEGFERARGPYSNHGLYKYEKPKWHKRREDGSYDIHGFEKRQRGDKDSIDLPACDAHGFVSKEKNISDNPLFNQKLGDRNCFRINGSTLLNSQERKGKSDFYIETDVNGKKCKIDIDGYNEYGFKRVVKSNGETVYVHRDTSSIYNKEGKQFDENSMSLKDAEPIRFAKQFIHILLSSKDMKWANMMIACRKCMEANPSLEYREIDIKNKLEKAFEIYQIYSPNAFKPSELGLNKLEQNSSVKFEGLDYYYQRLTASPNDKWRLYEFFEKIPSARNALKNDCIKARRELNGLKEKENTKDNRIIPNPKLEEKKQEIENNLKYYEEFER